MSAFGGKSGHDDSNRKSRLFDHLTRLEEQAEQSTLSDNVAKRAKGKEWNQYQQHDNAPGNQLMNRATADCGYRIHDPARMKVSDDHFLQHIQNQEQGQKSERPPERWPNECFFLMPFTEVNCVPNAHELRADQSLDSSDTEWRANDTPCACRIAALKYARAVKQT